ncbi:MAG: carboxypeptidase-like regulatory domain-containing protein [Tenuifilum sp.]|nr:carboxypeptidase-like regulatory domain-containing protein [Tenuifilum sp.]HOK85518.1 carboxypeptidase-like regulatory domain-containing protein [Tenuifilum sp.]HON69989.1 carboxypeptidase-like regulatory domain-containing protein [Tenuifilum sp.]HPP89904.1 carboxypeptidase-like regulatory domain-containing protein [Tenuifilum sp.]HQE53771.1 carboxypeptidase-like regulatory domain-containing protein [Tenuifilum sp.]
MKTLNALIGKSLRYSATAVALIISAVLTAQEVDYNLVNGVIKDAKTKERVVFATISVPGTTIGTVANADGEFTLKVPKTVKSNVFEITHLGYQNTQFPIVNGTSGKDKVYLIEPSSLEIQSVVIRPMDARTILEGALKNIDKNYSDKPVSFTAFYRESIKQRREYISIAEAVAEIYKAPYRYTLETDKVKIVKGRRGENVKKADTLMVKMQGGPHVSLYLDVIKNPELILTREDLPYYNYEVVDVVKIDNEANYVISFTPNTKLEYPLYQGKLYINTENLAITMAEFSIDLSEPEKVAQIFVRKKPAGLIFEPISTNYLVTYKKVNDKYHVNYMRSEVKFRADWRKRIFKTNYTIMSEMAITERNFDNVNKITFKESFKPNLILADRVNEYFDENYWGSYNTIEPDESIQSAISKFNKRFRKQ